MPLIKKPSKKAFEHNLKAEMSAGKPQDQSLAIAYDVKRRNAKKKMAQGGMVNESAKSEHRPMPDERDQDSKMISRNSGDKPAHNDDWSDRSTVAQAQRPSITPLSRPKMANGIYKVRDRDDVDKEEHMMDRMPPSSDKDQPDKEYDEMGANRQGPRISDMQDEHSTHRKPYAKGGEVEASDYSSPENKYEDDLLDLPPSEDEGASMARSEDEEGQNRQGPPVSDIEREHSNGRRPYASGGMINEEEQMEHEDSIAAAIMSKKERQSRLMSDSDEDQMVLMYEGGEIHSHDSIYSDESSQADLSRNADEDANEEDQLSFNALRKENYSESEGLSKLDSPMDSNEHGDQREDDSENEHDMISQIRSKMNRQRQFKVR